MARPSVERSILIENTPDEVYDIALTDVEGLVDWMGSVQSVDSVDDDWPDIGSSHTYTGVVSGQSYSGRTTILEADPPLRVVMREETGIESSTEKPSAIGQSVWTFTEKEGQTEMTIRLEAADRGPIFTALWNLFVRRRVGRSLEQSIQNLKRLCEEPVSDIDNDDEGG